MCSVSLFFDGFVSVWDAPTVAVLVMVPVRAEDVVTVIVNVVLAPLIKVPRSHVTVCPAAEHVSVDERNVVPVGRVSVTVTSVASDGHVLVTVMV